MAHSRSPIKTQFYRHYEFKHGLHKIAALTRRIEDAINPDKNSIPMLQDLPEPDENNRNPQWVVHSPIAFENLPEGTSSKVVKLNVTDFGLVNSCDFRTRDMYIPNGK